MPRTLHLALRCIVLPYYSKVYDVFDSMVAGYMSAHDGHVVTCCRNAFVRNVWEVDLHGLHVEEALTALDWQINVLLTLPCAPPPKVFA